jgi:hypothetical protein|uniref:Uncharacterized protein n=1 Tax=Siphoviridae sp. ct4Am4 TaxID=2826287 RepID=A0A8S5R2C7_9CAUD|nr:MAG TPA: hypothetical protein [Siphoviridae sp. ct4Am4]
MARLDTLPKFSELDNNRLLIVYTGRFSEDLYCDDVEIITKEDLLGELRANKLNTQEIEVYLVEKELVSEFSEDDLREMIENVMERDEQHKSWDEHMMFLIHDSPETKAFLQYLNGCAKELTTYTEGEQVEMDWRG